MKKEISTELSKLAQTQKAYKKEKEFSDILLNTIQDIITITRDDKLYKTNDAFYKYFDFKDLDDFRSKHDCICDLAIKKEGYLYKCQDGKKWYETISSDKNINHKMLIKTKDGQKRTFYVNSKIVEMDGSNIVISSFTDVSKIEQARLKAESQEEIMSRFLANMAHEIRTPISGIIGFAKMLSDTKLNEEQKEHLEIIYNSSVSLLSIINSILDFSKLHSNKIELEIIPINLIEAVEDVYNLLKFSANKKSINFNLSIDKEIEPNVYFDSTRLKQVITNLVSNAIKFTDENGDVDIRMELINASKEFQKVRISVIDNGIGIDGKNIEKIFSAFAQERSSTTRKYGGTGLGLSISKELVNIFGSKLQVESELNRGSRFYFDLLVKNSDIDDKEISAEDKLELYTDNLSILIVDDSNINITLMRAMLEHYNLSVESAFDGQEALNKAKEKDYDFIFMDVNMPVMDGIEAAKRIREFNKKVKIIAITANVTEDEKKLFKDSNINAYLTKPLIKGELERVLMDYNFDDTFNKTKKAVMFGDDLIYKLYNSFIEVSFETIKDLEEGLKNSDFNRMKNAAHKLKGSSSSIKIDYIENVCKSMEADAKEKKNEQFDIYINKIKKFVNFFESDFKKCLRGMNLKI